MKDLCERLTPIRGEDTIAKELQKNSTQLLCINLRSVLASKRVIKELKFYSNALDYLINEIAHYYRKSLVQPGEMVGAIAGQSIEVPFPQVTIPTYNFPVSQRNVLLGIPRLKEILNMSTKLKTPVMTVFLKPEFRQNPQTAKEVLLELEFTTIEQVTKKTEIWYDPDIFNTVIHEDREFLELIYDPVLEPEIPPEQLSKMVLRIEFDRDQSTDRLITLEEIARKIESKLGKKVNCIHSDQNAEQLIMHVRIRSRVPKAKDDFAELLREIESRILRISLGGIKGISKAFMFRQPLDKVDENGNIVKSNEWILDTTGTNLSSVLKLEKIDSTRTVSNDVVEILQVLGIEACRKVLMQELKAIVCSDGNYVNQRHLALLADVMTFRGKLSAIPCHTTGPLTRSTFRGTGACNVITEAAVFGEPDNLKGISDNLILGNLAPLGTGTFDLLLNDKELTEYVPTSTTHSNYSPPLYTSFLPSFPAYLSPTHGTFFWLPSSSHLPNLTNVPKKT